MNIRPSAAIRQNYNEIADLCRKTAEPIFLTKNGGGNLVVMDIETDNRREKMLTFFHIFSIPEILLMTWEKLKTDHIFQQTCAYFLDFV